MSRRQALPSSWRQAHTFLLAAWVPGKPESAHEKPLQEKREAHDSQEATVVLAFGGFSGVVEDSLVCIDAGK